MRKLAALTVVLAFTVTACGNGGDEDALGMGDRGLDRCSLITADEAEQWFGSPVSAAPSEGFDGEPDLVTCLYEAETGASVLIQVYDGDVFFAEVGSGSRTGETLEGLGEDAWTDAGTVKFLQNDWSASVSRIIGSVSDEALLEMARLMSSRLP